MAGAKDRKRKGTAHRLGGANSSQSTFNPTFTVPEAVIQTLASGNGLHEPPESSTATPRDPPLTPPPPTVNGHSPLLPAAAPPPVTPEQPVPQPTQTVASPTQAPPQYELNQDPLDMFLAAVTFARQVAQAERERADKFKSQAHDMERCADELIKLAEWLDCQIKALSEGLNVAIHRKAQMDYEELQKRDKLEKAERERSKQMAEQTKIDNFMTSMTSKIFGYFNDDTRRKAFESERRAIENEKRRLEEKSAEEEKRKQEQEQHLAALQKAEEERRAQEERRKLEEERRLFEQRQAEEEKKRLAEQQQAEEERKRAEAIQAEDMKRRLEMLHLEEEKKRVEQLQAEEEKKRGELERERAEKERVQKAFEVLKRDKEQMAKELDALKKETERMRKEEADRALKEKEAQERRRRATARQQLTRSSVPLSEPQKYAKAWTHYQAEWEFLTKAEYPTLISEIVFSHFPWPQLRSPTTIESISKTAIKEFLLSEHHSEGKAGKIRIREALRRWHPDKSELIVERIEATERDKIREGINLVIRHLNSIKDEPGV